MVLVEILLTAKLFSLNNIPILSYVIVYISNSILLSLVLTFKRNKWMILRVLPAFIATLMLLAFTVNDYYQYFPNIDSVFLKHYVRSLDSSSISEVHINKKYNLTSIENGMFAGGQNKGTVKTINMPGTISNLNARDGYVYLPPAYYDTTLANVKFPVMILLTGVPGDPSSWLQGGLLVNTMNVFASRHEGITPIIVIADQSGSFTNDTECLNSSHGNAETYLTVDVPNYIKTHYRVSDNPINWGIGGFSEGGMCGAMLTLTHQNIFRHFLDMSGDPDPFLDDYSQTLPVLFHNSMKDQEEHNIDWLLENEKLQPDLTAQFAIGGADSKKLIKEMRQSYYHSLKRNIPSSFEIIANDGHSFNTWSLSYSDALPKLSYYLGATDCETNCSEYR